MAPQGGQRYLPAGSAAGRRLEETSHQVPMKRSMFRTPSVASAGLPILTYHSLDESGSVISTAPSLFQRQMASLAGSGYQTLTLSEAARYLASGEAWPEKSVVLTFDDGYENVYREALPVLVGYGFRATIFPIAEYCGRCLDAPGMADTVGRRPFMDWPTIREMHGYGIEFGAHTLSHPHLTQIPLREAEREIVASKHQVEDCLGEAVEVFAYPYGSYNAQIKSLVSRHFLSAVSTRLGRARPGDDLHALCRMDTYYLKPSWLFRSLPHVTLDGYLLARQFLRDVKADLAQKSQESA